MKRTRSHVAENYDVAGNATYSTRREFPGGPPITAYGAQNIYYDALGRVRVTDKRGCKLIVDQYGAWHCNTLGQLPRSDKGYFSEYQYDALGRRVLVRARSDTNCDNTDGSCYSTLTRTVYDGDQVLYEIQVPGGDQVSPAQMALDAAADTAVFHPYGRVVYTHGLGLDEPADVIRVGYSPSWPDPVVMVPHSAADGGYDVGSFVDGHLKECKNYALSADSSCIRIDWPEQYYGPFFEDVATQYIPLAWFGSLIEGHRDASGEIFLRNRYYDPNTGRFTQEDPLGLGGGMNSYGFANGDPVNFADPFGLFDCHKVECPKSADEIATMKYVRQVAHDLLVASKADGGREYGAHIVRTKSGKLRTIDVTRGEISHVSLPPAPDNTVIEIHTHPDQPLPDASPLTFDFPSGKDAARANSFHVYGVVVSPRYLMVVPVDQFTYKCYPAGCPSP